MRQPTEVFDEWAIIGKDKGMETSHEASVSEILTYALARVKTADGKFTFLDVGCGNGWVADQLSNNENCSSSVGIDGAENMIANAKKRQSNAIFYLKDINNFEFKDKFDLVFSMEVFYYLDNPHDVIKKIHGMLNSNGRFIMGIDHYLENKECHNWQEKVGTRMHLFSEKEWLDFFKNSGFNEIHSWRANSNDWAGTLAITGTK